LILVFALSGAGWFAGTHTVVKTAKETFTVKKSSFGFQKIYVDTTQWNAMDYAANPDITAALASRKLDEMAGTEGQ
jgi:hypothetical protein